jgi:cytochrome P450 family 3 subfamily A
MKYMDMVIDETLRLYPIGAFADRVASNDYEYKGLKIKKDQLITIPIYALHRDPEIYPNPDEFDPERFSDENKRKRENESFMPFGAGPRNCIGMRFALTEVKLLLTSVLSKYNFQPCDQTPVIIYSFMYLSLNFFLKCLVNLFYFTKENIELLNSTLLKSKNPIYVKVTPR